MSDYAELSADLNAALEARGCPLRSVAVDDDSARDMVCLWLSGHGANLRFAVNPDVLTDVDGVAHVLAALIQHEYEAALAEREGR